MCARLFLSLLARNPVSLVGIAVVTTTAILFLVSFLFELFGLLANPYLGLLLFVAIPAVFILGLLLIPIGMWWTARRTRRGAAPPEWPVIDLRTPRHQSVVLAILALTAANVVLISMAACGGVHYMETAEFCGRVCHTTMEPQYAAYQAAPHARVACVSCHVGSGMSALIESKLAGTRQLWHVVVNTVPRPVPSPVRSMRPARDTCDQCHWPDKFHGDEVRVIREYADDEKNTEMATTLVLHVGGGSVAQGVGTGIHWHMNLDNEIEYVTTDSKRETIPYVRLRDRTDDTINTASLYLDLLRAVRNTDIRFGYDYSDSDNSFVHGGPRIAALASINQFIPLPDVENTWHLATADVQYFFTSRVGIGVGYYFEKIDIVDFNTIDTNGPGGLTPQTGEPRIDWLGGLITGYGNRPYTGHTAYLRVVYRF